MATKKARILLACVPQAYTRLFAILSGHELSFVSTFGEAQAALKGDSFSMIMIGVHFDESKMFDLLQHLRADKKYDSVPVLCFRGVAIEDANGKLVEAGVEAACTAMGAAFFDLTAFTDDNSGNTAVRKIIHGLLTGN